MNKALISTLYVRVSTGRQAEEDKTSLAAQEEACRKQAAELGATVGSVHSDPGVSGELYLNRPGIQAALADIETGRANLLVIFKVDRSGRNARIILDIAERVFRAKALLAFTDHGIVQDTASARAMFGIKAVFAEWEKGEIAERTKAGRRRLAEKGLQPNANRSPYGYHVVSKPDILEGRYPPGTFGTYQVIEEQAEHVREIFRQYAQHGNLAKICRWLEGQGIPPPGMVHNGRGAHWYPQTIRIIMLHPLYKGKATYGRRELLTDESRVCAHDPSRKVSPRYLRTAAEDTWIYINAPALVEEAVWDACQVRLQTSIQEKQVQLGGNPRRKQMLSTLARCADCGHRMGTWRKEGLHYLYYVCMNRYCEGSGRSYSAHPARAMEDMTVKALLHLAEYPELVNDSVRAFDDQQKQRETGDAPAERRKLQSALEEIRKKEDVAANAQIEARMSGRSSAVYDRMLADLSCQRVEIETRLHVLRPVVAPTVEKVTNVGQKMALIIQAMEKVLTAPEEDFAPWEKQEILRGIVERVTPFKDGVEVIVKTETIYYIKTYAPALKGTAPKPADPPVP